MRLVFFGTPEPVVAPLAHLLEAGGAEGHEVVCVVTQPARPVGRKGVLTDPPVATFAKERGILCLQPEKASDPDFLARFRELEPDVAITAAYGQILTEEFLSIPRRATINVHPSLLPKYRGAIPIPAALLAGDEEVGVSILFTVKKLDAGNLILQSRGPVAPGETAGPLTSRLFAESGPMLIEALRLLGDPEFTGTPQDETKVSHCRKIDKADGQVDWTRSAREIVRRFRAFDPWPGTFTFLGDKRISLTDLSEDGQSRLGPGEVMFDKERKALEVGSGDGTVLIARLKPAGGKEVDAAGFWNGLKRKDDVRFTHIP